MADPQPTVPPTPKPKSSLTVLMSSPARSVPVTAGLLAVNVGVFALMLLAGAGFWHTPKGVQLAWGANFGPATQDGQWWRLFTALFIHFGVVHLALNMWALWDVGRLVEQLYGRWRFALLYVLSGLLGNLVSLVLHGNEAVSGGASGAIFSLYGALLVFLWRERQNVEPGEFRWLFGGAAVFASLMLGVGFIAQGIDNAAHGGGLLAGALLGLVLARRWGPNGATPPTGLAWTITALLLLGTSALVWRLPEPSDRLARSKRRAPPSSNFWRKTNALAGAGAACWPVVRAVANRLMNWPAALMPTWLRCMREALSNCWPPSRVGLRHRPLSWSCCRVTQMSVPKQHANCHRACASKTLRKSAKP